MQSYVIDLLGPVSQILYAFLNGLNAYIQQLVPGIDDSAYPGYVDDQLPDYLTAYWGGHVERLVSVKGRYDPGNVFRNPQSVPSPYGGRQGPAPLPEGTPRGNLGPLTGILKEREVEKGHWKAHQRRGHHR